MCTSLRIDFDTDPDDMSLSALLESEILSLARSAGLEELAAMGVLWAVVEAVNNIVQHAYGQARGHTVKLRGDHEAGTLQIQLRDHGVPMPLPLPAGEPADGMATHGRGWQIIRAAFPVVRYERVDGENRLTLIRPLTVPAGR